MGLFELIADPVRLQIVRRLASAAPASLQELADAADVHINTARAHVSALEDAGAIVSRPRPRAGRGKQSLEYELAEGWSLGSDDFRPVAEMLATGFAQQGIPSEVRVELGRAWGRYVVGRPGVRDPPDEVVRALEWFGAIPQIEDDRLELTGCLCPLVSPGEPRVVCDLVAGLVDGVLEASGSPLTVAERHHDHDARHCQIMLRKSSSQA